MTAYDLVVDTGLDRPWRAVVRDPEFRNGYLVGEVFLGKRSWICRASEIVSMVRREDA